VAFRHPEDAAYAGGQFAAQRTIVFWGKQGPARSLRRPLRYFGARWRVSRPQRVGNDIHVFRISGSLFAETASGLLGVADFRGLM